MWIFLPSSFYSTRPYDPAKGGIDVDEPHIVLRARLRADIDAVSQEGRRGFDLGGGTDYRYHYALPINDWASFLVRQSLVNEPMKDPLSPRNRIHAVVWRAAAELQRLDA